MSLNEVRVVVDSTWIEKAVEVINKLWTDFEEDCHNLNYTWEGLSLKEIAEHLASLTPEEYEKEVGYAKGNFHCLVHIYGGPLHHQLVPQYLLPNPTAIYQDSEGKNSPYGGGFVDLTEDDIRFLQDSGYEVRKVGKRWECRLPEESVFEQKKKIAMEKIKTVPHCWDALVANVTNEYSLWLESDDPIYENGLSLSGKNPQFFFVLRKAENGNRVYASYQTPKEDLVQTKFPLTMTFADLEKSVEKLEKRCVVCEDGEYFPKE